SSTAGRTVAGVVSRDSKRRSKFLKRSNLMGMAVGGGSGGPKADINMTPMIDVLLVLIIIFMVITPLTPKGLEALVPQPPPPNQKPNQSDQRTVVIVIDANHNMSINSEGT